jgi:hypothetical protein
MQLADAEGFNVRRRQHRSIRYGEDVEVRRSPQAVACKKRDAVELGKPRCAPDVDSTRSRWVVVRRLYASGVSYQAWSAVGKASHKGKDLTEAHSPQRKLVPDM